ncbi:sodium:dicarboxylate symporter [Martensiomyces pterosporus]|nr:sodium:dicarboxylate symporter [Martensiomyces pterosporus]
MPVPATHGDDTSERPSAWSRMTQSVKNALAPPFRFVIKWLRKTNLTMWIILGLVLGIVIGHTAPSFSVKIKPLADIFLRMISTLVVPLIFSTLVVGIAGHGDDLAAVGRLAIKSLIYFEIVSTLAILLGLLMVNAIKPGKGTVIKASEDIPKTNGTITWDGELFKIIPKSFFQAASDGEVLQIVFCAIMFAVALCRVPARKHRQTMLAFLKSLSETMFKVTGLVMNYAPIGIGCALASTVGKNGLSVLISLGKLVGALYGTLVIFIIVVLIPIMLIAKIPIKTFFRTIWQPFILAFSTASSESALPKAMENLEKMGIPEKIVGFVIPTGYSFNLDGTSLYLSLAAIFCAQATDTHLSASKQVVLMFTLMLTSKGVAAIPRASFVVLSAALSSYNIPNDALALILGVDAFMDMARTGVNVMGNCLAACVVARWEGAYPPYGRWEGRWAHMDPRLRAEDEDDEDNVRQGDWKDSHSESRKIEEGVTHHRH